jgi:hypothetical protein
MAHNIMQMPGLVPRYMLIDGEEELLCQYDSAIVLRLILHKQPISFMVLV